jgi:hypothetical protein
MFQILKNPTAFKKVLNTPGVGEVPIIREIFSSVSSDLSRTEPPATFGERDSLAYKIEAASKLGITTLTNQLGPTAAEQIMDASSKFKQLGRNQEEVFQEIATMNALRNDPTRPIHEWNEDQLLPGARRDATIDESYDVLMTDYPDHEERGVKNRAMLKRQMGYELDTQYAIHGDYHRAAKATAAIFAQGTSFIGNNWVHKGKKADVNFPGGNAHEFINGEYQRGILPGSTPSPWLTKIYDDNNLPDDVDLLRDAESIQTSPDGKSLFFHIRLQGANFLNTQVKIIEAKAPPPGTPLQKAPFKYSSDAAWQKAKENASQLNVPGILHNMARDNQ